MKIVILADPLDNQSAGIHIYTKGMINALIDYDTTNEYILIREKIDDTLPSKVRQIAIPNNRFLMIFASIRLFIIIPLIIRWLRADAVIEPAHFGPFNLPRHIRRINIIHDLTPLIFPEHHRWHSQILQRIFLQRILKKSTLILAASNNTANDIKRFFPFVASKTQVLYPSHQPNFKPTYSVETLEKWQINLPYFLSVSTIEPRKNLVTLLKAYQEFREQHSQKVLLVMVGGKGWKSENFYEALAQHPFKRDIILTEYVDKSELPILYTHAISLVYPSLYEGFGLPVLESMACGTTVIGSNHSSIPEVGGKAIYYFNPKKVTELTELLLLLARDEELVISQNSKVQKQAASFTWKKYVANFSKYLEESNRF